MPASWQATGYATGTFVQTAKGMRQIERLEPGVDVIEFRDGTQSRLVHVLTTHFTADDLAQDDTAQPIHIPALALGDTVPQRPLTLAGSVHVLASGRMVSRVSDGDQLLLPISALVGHNGIDRVIPDDGVTYHHLLCEDHGILRVENLMCETLFIGHSADPDLVVGVFDHADGVTHSTPAVPHAEAKVAGNLIGKLREKNRPLINKEEVES
ncbi:MAG: Hint domain-containing protein [Pseudomonadota bacterium]